MNEINEYMEINNTIKELIEATKTGDAVWKKVTASNVKKTYEHSIAVGALQEVYECKTKIDLLFYVGAYRRINYSDDDLEYESKHYYLSKADHEGTLITYEDSELNREVFDYSNQIYRLMRLIKLTKLNSNAKPGNMFN